MRSLTNTQLLKAKMIEKGYTQERLAAEMGLSRTSVNHKINGEKDFTAKEIYFLCDILNIKEKDPIFFAHDVDDYSTN
ncbi:MAG: helix-turn-helix domain-containing protein [Bacillota bacterium]|jgi:transcriptional regulator with XRE-family HTH domain